MISSTVPILATKSREEKRYQFNYRRGLIYQTPYAKCPGIGFDKSSRYNEWIKEITIRSLPDGRCFEGPS